jgi:hypothetical protein
MQYQEFSPEEQEVLNDLLQHGIAEIDIEVFRTDSRNFKQMLRHRREVLEHLLAKLTPVPIEAAA